jgi:DNA helicase-2/ATP-dependent DNA helicase PcrA
MQSVCLYEDNRKEAGKSSMATLENFLHEVSLLQEQSRDQEASDQVQMMTLHAAKGLEFKIVLISGVEEGLLPSTKSLNAPEALEEERRLFYVGITRAQEYLLLFCANFRNTFGQIVNQVASRFVDEMPHDLVQRIDFEKMTSSQISVFFAKLLGGKPAIGNVVTFGGVGNAASRPGTGDSRFASHKVYARPAAPGTQKSSYSSPAYPYADKPKTNRQPSLAVDETPQVKALGGWAKNQTVHHAKFGTGIVTEVEKAEGDDFYITALFRIGKKKILSGFLSKD